MSDDQSLQEFLAGLGPKERGWARMLGLEPTPPPEPLDERLYPDGPSAYRISVGELSVELRVHDGGSWRRAGMDSEVRQKDLRGALSDGREVGVYLTQVPGRPWAVENAILWWWTSDGGRDGDDLPLSAVVAVEG